MSSAAIGLKSLNSPIATVNRSRVINKFKILLIDDDEDDFVNIREIFSEISRSQYNLVWKSSYQDGIQSLKTETYDACLLDFRLGAKTGLELLHEINRSGPNCPIIFLTGHSDFDLDLQAMQVGASDYLIKDQLSAPLLERSIRYSIKHAMDMEELRESKAQILQQDRLASLGLLASSLAHEIGTPMGIIRSRAELAERKSSDSSVKQDMQVVVTQIDRIAKLVNSLLHLARGSKSEHSASVNLNQVISDILNLIEPELKRKNIRLETAVADSVNVKSEAGPLGQVILNLLVNAIHAIEEKALVDNALIRIQVEEKTDSVKLVLHDNGSGISEENLSQIFKPFFTTKEIGKGSGLGLATSYKLVHSWGGSISVQSKSGSGTTFTISLLKA
ncbi:MAG: ATP-binding protein [Pseudobdellovibrio sp.]